MPLVNIAKASNARSVAIAGGLASYSHCRFVRAIEEVELVIDQPADLQPRHHWRQGRQQTGWNAKPNAAPSLPDRAGQSEILDLALAINRRV